jgi:hypothetical protein
MLGLAAVAALAALMLTGAGPAAAAQIDKCLIPANAKLKSLSQAECESHNGIIDTSSVLTSDSTIPELVGTLKETCEKSSITVKSVGNAEGAKATIEALTFEGGCKPCSSVIASGLPYGGKVTMNAESYALEIEGKGEATLSLAECPLGAKCSFSMGNVKLPLVLNTTTYEGHEFSAKALGLKRVAGTESFCGEAISWSAGYAALSSGPWFLFLLP